jgi:hypothetical protein
LDVGPDGNGTGSFGSRSAGARFNSVTFIIVFGKAIGVSFAAARDASRWRGFHDDPYSLSDEELTKLLAPWIPR